jgi:HSP20 family protein
LRKFEDLYQQVDRLVQSALGSSAGAGPWLPAADVSETDDAYVVEIELPGVKRDDVDVELNGNELVVTGELKEQERKGLLRRRRSASSNIASHCPVISMNTASKLR